MRFTLIAVTACAVTVQAFKDTAPFLMFSNKGFPEHLQDSAKTPQLQSSTDVLQSAKEVLGRCATEKYYIVSQPGLDIRRSSTDSPYLGHVLSHKTTQSKLVVSQVVGLKGEHRDELVKLVQEKCGAKVSNNFVERARYGAREVATQEFEVEVGGWTDGEKKLGQSDPVIQSNVLKDLIAHHSYTFVLLATPSGSSTKEAQVEENTVYEALFEDSVHMDLKRNIYVRKKNSTGSSDQRPLFEKYQFLTPGLFMGLLVGFILISILSVGLSAIAGLKVSYGAFDKENGPNAQKKAQ